MTGDDPDTFYVNLLIFGPLLFTKRIFLLVYPNVAISNLSTFSLIVLYKLEKNELKLYILAGLKPKNKI